MCKYLLCALIALGAITPQVVGQLGHLEYRWNGSDSYDYLGRDGIALGDLNGDGCDDFGYRINGLDDFVARSGSDGAILYNFSGTGIPKRADMWPVGDVDLDAAMDFMLVLRGSTPNQIISGATGATLFSLGSSGATDCTPIDDLDFDGIGDYAIGQGDEDQVLVVSGQTGNVIVTLAGSALGLKFGEKIAHLGDLNGDGLPELAVGAPNTDYNGHRWAGEIIIYSLIDQGVMKTFTGVGNWDEIGLYEVESGDVNGDGFLDIGYRLDEDYLVFSGQDFSQLYRIGPRPSSNYLYRRMSIKGDVNGDGYADIATGCLNATVNGVYQCGAVWIYSGKTGQLMDRIEGDSINATLGIGDTGLDVNADGFSDILLDSSPTINGMTAAGSSLLYLGGRNPLLTISNFVAGQQALIEVNSATPNDIVFLAYSLNGSGPIRTPYGFVDIGNPYTQINLRVDALGVVAFTQNLPGSLTGLQVWIQAFDRSSKLFTNPLALVIG